MMRYALLLAALLAGPALAEAPVTSPRPVVNPLAQVTARGAVTPAQIAPAAEAARPNKRPFLNLGRKKAKTPEAEVTTAAAPQAQTDRPKRRGLLRRAAQPVKRYPVKGSVCNDRTIRGSQAGNIDGRGACGIPNAVRVTEVGGVALSAPALIDCTTAHRLNAWVQNVARPAVGNKGGGLSELRLMSSYSCRTRNNKAGAKLSEHAKGRAVDIGGFTTADGTKVSVLKGWRDKTFGPVLKEMHRGACGRFGTVLGPQSDRYHQDHFHFDTANYRSGAYCR